MNTIKKVLGVCWLIIAPAIIYMLVHGAIIHIDTAGNKDINNPVIWIIIILIFTPVAVGLMIFGVYALKGEYDRLPEKSSDFE